MRLHHPQQQEFLNTQIYYNYDHTSIDTEAHWTKSGWHGWVYGWKLHLIVTAAAVWIPLAAELTAANAADDVMERIARLTASQVAKALFEV